MLFTTAALAASMISASVQERQPEVTVYRSWRAPNVTVVEGMFRVDPQLLGTSDCSYGVELTVEDAAGTVLTQEDWSAQCPVQDGRPAAALETFRFQILPGAYSVVVSVYPSSNSTQRTTTVIPLQGIEANPRVSDLILARDVAFVDSSTGGQWTLRRGDIGLRLDSETIVRPGDAELSYYLELYPDVDDEMTGSVSAHIRRSDGRELTRVTLQSLNALTEPRPIAGSLPVAGLPEGSYVFETQVQLTDTTIVRTHPFKVAGAVADASRTAGWFATISDQELSELFDPVVVWLRTMSSAATARMYPTLPPHAKRELLAREFGGEGPTPDDGEESALDAYLSRVNVVNARFAQRSGRGEQNAWETDRGRIYLIRGEPGSQVTRPSPSARSPYEIWHYPSGQGLVYLFADDTRMGHYRLIYTNDPTEQSAPDWSRLVASEALEDLARLGIRPPGTTGPQ